MRTYLILFLSLLPLVDSKAQNFQQNTLETQLTAATVFIEGAQVTRQGQISLPAGRSEMIIKQLSPHIDEKSIQVKATGDFTILSVNHVLNHLDELKKDKVLEALQFSIDSLVTLMKLNRVRLDVLKEQESLLGTNKNIGGENNGASVSELKEAIDFYDAQLMAIKTEIYELNTRHEKWARMRHHLDLQIASIKSQEELPTGEIKIRVDVPSQTKGTFSITYLVANAGWFPKYDVRVTSIDAPLNLRYKAEIHQNTGVDWKDVNLRLSSGTPNQSGLAPELQKWNLNYARHTIYQRYQNGQIRNDIRHVRGTVLDDDQAPIPGVNVVVKGTTVGTITDINGNYSLTIPNGATTLTFSFIGMASKELPINSTNISTQMVSEVMYLESVAVKSDGFDDIRIRGYSAPKEDADFLTTAIIENQTTVEFEVEQPYSIQSNGEKLTVDLTAYEIEANYEYLAAPKLDKDAFLMAYVTNWGQYNLLEGEANLYFEDTYVGRSILDAQALKDTLSISMGRDKSIVIERTKIDDFTKVKSIGSNRVESRGYQIKVRNKKNQEIRLTLTDQIPVPVINDISVDIKALSAATLEESTGLIRWNMTLKPQQQQEIAFSYVVKYPKREVVNLD
ncbi:MAG: mucoidy inhibitor MuiA family protein [Cytophagales bacterium]|nr:mucoidy inhibitor MuiA family protein [Cytophagales bacterium]